VDLNSSIIYKYSPQVYQQILHYIPVRFKTIAGGIRSGKTYSAIKEFFKRVCEDVKRINPSPFSPYPLHYWIVTPDYNISKVAMRELFATIYEEDRGIVKKWKQSYRELWLWPNVLIEFKTASDPKVLVSVKLHGLLIDEAARIHQEAWMGGLRGRLTDYRGWGIFATSPIGRNWFYREIFLRGLKANKLYDPEFVSFIFKTAQNKYIPREEIESARRQLPLAWYMREYEASFDDFHGQIFDHIKRDTHTYTRLPERFDIFCAGIDWGYSTPGCISLFGHSDVDNTYYGLETVYKSHMLVTDPNRPQVPKPRNDCKTWLEHALRIKKKYNDVVFYPGKDKPEYIEIFRSAGLTIGETDYSVNAGIQTLCRLHAKNKTTGYPRVLYPVDTPQEVWDNYAGYSWKEDREGNVTDEPVSKNDHNIDSDRYVLHSRESTKAGFAVVSSSEPDWYDESTYLPERRSLIWGNQYGSSPYGR
jgi:hypothetical protein